MKRFFTFAVAAALAAGVPATAWSQAGQGGGAGGTTSGAGAAETSAETPNTAGAIGNAEASGTATSTTTSGPATTGTPTTTGAAGRGQFSAENRNFGASAQAQGQVDFNGVNPTPFFTDRGVRQQLNLNDNQFDALNRAYQEAYNRYNQNISGLGTDNAASRRAQNLQRFQDRINDNPNVGAGTTNAAQQRAARLQEFRNRFDTEFNQSVDQTLTDPQLRARYNQLNNQFQGVNAFNNAATQRQLNLTPNQQRQLRRLANEWRQQIQQWRRGLGNNADANLTQQQWAQMRAQYQDQLGAILTPAQQQQWSQATGQAYDFPYQTYFPGQPAPDANPQDGTVNGNTGTSTGTGVGTGTATGTGTGTGQIAPDTGTGTSSGTGTRR